MDNSYVEAFFNTVVPSLLLSSKACTKAQQKIEKVLHAKSVNPSKNPPPALSYGEAPSSYGEAPSSYGDMPSSYGGVAPSYGNGNPSSSAGNGDAPSSSGAAASSSGAAGPPSSSGDAQAGTAQKSQRVAGSTV